MKLKAFRSSVVEGRWFLSDDEVADRYTTEANRQSGGVLVQSGISYFTRVAVVKLLAIEKKRAMEPPSS